MPANLTGLHDDTASGRLTSAQSHIHCWHSQNCLHALTAGTEAVALQLTSFNNARAHLAHPSMDPYGNYLAYISAHCHHSTLRGDSDHRALSHSPATVPARYSHLTWLYTHDNQSAADCRIAIFLAAYIGATGPGEFPFAFVHVWRA